VKRSFTPSPRCIVQNKAASGTQDKRTRVLRNGLAAIADGNKPVADALLQLAYLPCLRPRDSLQKSKVDLCRAR
jgi:hypothetical protein